MRAGIGLAQARYERTKKWHDEVREEMRNHVLGAKPLEPKVFQSNTPAKWYIAALTMKDIPCKVVNLGAGVKKVIVAEQVCPHCNGKGVI